MDERKILYFVLTVIIYCLYSALMWYARTDSVEKIIDTPAEPAAVPIAEAIIIKNKTEVVEPVIIKKNVIPLCYENACCVLEIFTTKPPGNTKTEKPKEMDADTNSLTVFGITIFLIVLVINAIMDVLKVKEEERIKMKLNPDGGRRQSLAEFANKKTLRRDSSRFGLQLFQITENTSNGDEEEKKKSRRQTRPYTRGESTNSYLSEKNAQKPQGSPSRSCETPTGEPRLVKRQSVAKIFGSRPAPMVRRSSFPVLPLNPDIQALMLGHRRPSITDSDDEDGKGRRVRIIRRY